ncbi:MAG: hypothetical protein HQ464_12215 [Planctomycetes bacterium]|nr:hypothetical protein [Planctomycetota bacterium]
MTALERGYSRPRLISNVTASGQFIGDADETLHRMMESLRDSGRLYRQGNTLIFLQGGNSPGGGCSPTPIVVDGVVSKIAPAIVRNVVMCRELRSNPSGKGKKVDQPIEYELQFAVPQSVLQQVVATDGFVDQLPMAQYIINHPVFDKDFNWLDVGYHRTQQILVCGESFEPAILDSPILSGPVRTVLDALDRLPPLTRRMVEGFYWAGPVDVINMIGAALMTPLMPMLVEDKHPGVMAWANKPSIGKTLACQCLAILKDGESSAPSSVENGARELENQIVSEMNDGRTVIFLDNLKGKLDEPVLESNMTSSQVSIRGFHIQRKVRRPNDLLWLITTNDAVPSDDLLSRCIHIHLHYEGEPDSRAFAMSDGELANYVRDNRADILAELAGMVVRWLDAGCSLAPAPCRFTVFGQVVGSVLTYNGLPGFLSNTREEVRQHSTTHQQLVAITERLLDGRNRSFVWEVDGDIDAADEAFKRGPRPENPQEQKDWVHILTSAGVITAASSTPEKQKTAATQYLNSIVNVPVDVDVGEHTIQAKIVSRSLGRRRVAYALAVKGLSAVMASDEGDGGAADAQPADLGAAISPAVGDHAAVLSSPYAGDGEEEQEDDLWGPTSG